MRRQHWLPFFPVLVAFLLLSILYARATPILEASDELWHMGMVDYIADNWRLPVQNPDIETTYRQEGSQPPLYYALSALIVSGINRDDLESYLDYNPHARVGIPGSVGNKNILLHDLTPPPQTNTALAVYTLRGFSILLACVTLFGVYAATSQISGPSYAALATALTAFNPMFLFISASVNNDNLVTALVSLVLWQVIVLGWYGFKLWRSVFIGVGIALAALSKLSGLVLIPVVLFAAGYVAYRRDDQRGFNVLFGISLAAGLLISGWWYLRNILLYGELFGTEIMVQVAGPRLEPFTPITAYREAWGFFISYWGLFGGVNIPTFEWYYLLVAGLSLLAIVGLALGLYRNLPYILRDMRQAGRVFAVTDLLNMYWMYAAAVFAAAVGLGLVGVITWTAQTYASQGRLLFPFIVGISALMASGLQYFVRRERKWVLTAGIGGSLGLLAAIMPFTHIVPAYRPPATVDQLPESARGVYARYGHIELLGYETPDKRYFPGDTLPVTLYWRPLQPSERDLSAFITALDAETNLLGKVDTYPGAGTLRTTTWEPDRIYQDVYGVPLSDGLSVQSDIRLQIGWWHYPTATVIQPKAENGAAIASVMLDAGGFVGDFVPDGKFTGVPRGVVFDGRIQLIGVRAALPGKIELVWRANRNVTADYTVFIQVIDERSGAIIAQGDAPPQLSTSYWRRGDVLVTEHDIIPQDGVFRPGAYRVLGGWYNPTDLTRLNLRNDQDDALPLGRFSFP